MMEATAFFGRPDAVVVLITSEMGHKQASYRPRSPAMSAHLAFVDNAHFAQENGAFRPRLLPFCYHQLFILERGAPGAIVRTPSPRSARLLCRCRRSGDHRRST